MALNGTLADIGIVDLLQFPNAGRKTGELLLASQEAEARFYYAKGKLVHAVAGELEGREVLVEVLGWTEGVFEFRLDVAPPRTTIEADLHRVVMEALKTRDERRMAAEQSAAGRSGGALDPRLRAALADFVGSAPYLKHVSVVAPDATVIAEADGRGAAVPGTPEFRAAVCGFAGHYPRAGLRRLIIDDELGTAVCVNLPAGAILLVLASQGTPLGAVTVAVGKLAAALGGRGGAA